MATAGVLSQGTAPEIETDSPLHANAAPTAGGSRPQIPPNRSMVALEDGAITADEEAVDDLDESLLPVGQGNVHAPWLRLRAAETIQRRTGTKVQACGTADSSAIALPLP
ncbi:hypothetical protein LTR29_006096 [Friedmanniomyces endolithicus]|nr:hypothetical protein LTR29_006096 [Friedmanniomyces endolithicus]